jgi:hypothetical protein
MFGAMMGGIAYLGFFKSDGSIRGLGTGFTCALISLLCIFAIIQVLRKSRIAWHASIVVGVTTVIVSLIVFVLASEADPRGDGGEIGVVGIALLVFAVPAFFALQTLRPEAPVEL